MESLTHRRVRETAARELKLPEGFFKADAKWNAKSKAVIVKEVDKHEAKSSTTVKEKSEPTVVSKPQRSKAAPATASKRKSVGTTANPSKRRKNSPTPSDESELSDIPSVTSQAVDFDTVDSGEKSEGSTKREEKIVELPNVSPDASKIAKDDNASESELSVVLDDTPPSKRRRPKSAEPKSTKAKPAKASKARADSSAAPSNPQDEEIKRLQGWLVKCGIRKVWSKELAKCSNERERISHLKTLLKDAGMTGRFSEEKAKQIKEEREFKKDLEAIQEGNEIWGKSGEDESDEDSGGKPGRPKRRIARGLKELQQFDEDEESE